MVVNKGMVMEAIVNLEKIKNRLGLYIEELHTVKDKITYIDEDYDRNYYISKCIEDIVASNRKVITIVEMLYTILNYYEKCEEDNVIECYDEKIMYSKKESTVVDLGEIHSILKSFEISECEEI